ncbi:SusC/RagA family TonB-linked outer membrane protein [Aquimarina megaterium]|uniref:SusC/RagA family TonB-linked outer membrane protein n=1 Tax=Aquimarina megaterium TaxID=1443666 RepID=UPI0004703267|nr:TonB-dependent receptor [Aquimarina megaterium]
MNKKINTYFLNSAEIIKNQLFTTTTIFMLCLSVGLFNAYGNTYKAHKIGDVLQEREIKGKVTDDSGIPLPGVAVIIKGSNQGAQTDFDGNYIINAKAGEILMFSYIGMKTEERIIDAISNTINIEMVSDTQELEEIVVLGYTTRGKNEITGSTVQVVADEINDVPVVTVDQALQGKVAGLNIASSSGTPGSTQQIRIRGVGSITSSNAPLFVIDGVPMVNYNTSGSSSASSLSSLSSINSRDVESITVLKDASATAAYGARGSNGVIVITTKNGRKNRKTTFNFTSTYGYQEQAVKGPKMLTAAQREELFYDAVFNTYGETYSIDRSEAKDLYERFPGFWGTSYTDWNTNGRPEANWQEIVKTDNPALQTFDFSATGGSETSTFYTSLGYNKTEGIVKGTDYERITAKFNFSKDMTNSLKFINNLSVSNIDQNGLFEQGAFFASGLSAQFFVPPTLPAYNADGTLNLTDFGSATNYFNYLYLIENDIINNDVTRAMNSTTLEWKILKGLKFKTNFSIDYNLANYKNFSNRVHGNAVEEGGSSYASTSRNFNWVTQNSLNYKTSLDRHSFDITILQEFQKNKYNFISAQGEKFPKDGLTFVDEASINFEASTSFSDWKNLSYLGMLNYNFDDKYILDATYRREASSRFSRNQRFGDFWSIGAAWNITSEEFLYDSTLFSNLRLRASYGTSGSAGVDINEYQSLLAYDADYNANPGIYPIGYGNEFLSWEKNNTLDMGIDFGLFNDKISGSVAYYNKKTFDILQEVGLSRTTGFADVNRNIGEVVNKGIEIELNYNIISGQDFNWSIFGNIATVDNEVKKLAKDASGNDIVITTGTRRVEVGHPIYEWYMRKWAGVDPENGDPLWYINGVDGETTNNFNEAEVAFQGSSAIPTYSGGFGTHIDYKGFFIDANLYFTGGNKVYESWSYYTKSNGLNSTLYFNGTEELLQSWKKPGDITDYPALQSNTGAGNQSSSTSTRFLYDGDYIRLRELVLGYNLTNSALETIGVDGITFTLRGTNLFTWVKDDRLKHDPEVRTDGFTRLTTPPVKSFVFGVNLKF